MLLSVSNHPPDTWGPGQHAAAAAYGEVRHVPFPRVPPDADTDAVEALADALAPALLATLPPGPDHAALVAGEPTLTLALVARLQRAGRRCLAATTERRTFAFVRFRDYPPLFPDVRPGPPPPDQAPGGSTPDDAPLPVTALPVRLTPDGPLDLGPFAGFPLYGALKQRAREAGCRWRPSCAARCARPSDCAFGRTFEPPGPGRQRRGPLPLVLHLAEPRRVGWRPGEPLAAELRVLGPNPGPVLDLLREALDAIATHGLGAAGRSRSTVRVEVDAPRRVQPEPVPDGPRLTVALETPLRLRLDDAWVTPDGLTAEALLRAASRRACAVRRALALPLPPAPPDGLADRLARTDADLRWQRLRRPSRSGGHNASGLVGTATFEGDPDDVIALGRYLAEATRLHLGAKTAMALGALRILTA